MAVSIRVEPIDKDIALFLNDIRSPAHFVDLARQVIEDTKRDNAAILGRVPPFTIFVDGQRGAPIEAVKPGGVIVVEFQLIADVLRFIGEQLVRHSPHKTGRYEHAHVLLADGSQIDFAAPVTKLATEYVFVNTVPYARKIERGQSPQAPHGVYEVVATLAKRRFSRLARIEFNYRTLVGGTRQPAIIIKTR
jgi:hypothetical protein